MPTWVVPSRISRHSPRHTEREYRVSSGEDIRYQRILKARDVILELKLAFFHTLDLQLLESTRRYQVLDSVVKVAVFEFELGHTLPDSIQFFFG